MLKTWENKPVREAKRVFERAVSMLWSMEGDMVFIEYDAKNEVGIAQVDGEHRELFGIMNELHAATVAGREQAELVDILNILFQRTREHFLSEEKLMVKYAYPELPRHKDEHDWLAAQAEALQEQFQAGSATITPELLVFLHDWLKVHTAGTDREMGRFLKKAMS